MQEMDMVTCFMYACKYKHYDCAFAVMDAGGTVDMMQMRDCGGHHFNHGIMQYFLKTNSIMTLPSLVISGVERRLQEIDQVRKSLKTWSPTLVEEEILPFIYCESNLKYLKIVGENNLKFLKIVKSKTKTRAEVEIIETIINITSEYDEIEVKRIYKRK